MATIEKIEPMRITIGEKTYTLEFNRNSVASVEKMGLDVQNLFSAPMSTIPPLFYAAFKMHHPDMTRKESDRILFDEMNGLTAEEITRLCELYAAPTNALIHSAEEERKNVTVSL